MIPLKTKVKDKLTGFVGIATARCEYFTGCIIYEVIPTQLKNGLPQKEQWLDEQRLIPMTRTTASKSTHEIGSQIDRAGPQSPPERRSHPFDDE